MLPLEAGAKAGGDKRCGERKASSAFLTVCKPEDIDKHWLNLVIYGNDDHTNAVEALREKFDNWKTKEKIGINASRIYRVATFQLQQLIFERL